MFEEKCLFLKLTTLQDRMDILNEQRESDGVHPPFGNDDIGVALGGLDEVTMHGFHRREVLLEHRVHITSALLDITHEATSQAHVIIGINEDLDVHQFAELLVLKDQDTIKDQDLRRLDTYRLRQAVVVGEGVDGALDALPLLELADMLDHHIRVKGVRVVVVELGALLETEIIMRLVVEVVAERRDVLIGKGLLELAYEG